jgi:hypothetical protein
MDEQIAIAIHSFAKPCSIHPTSNTERDDLARNTTIKPKRYKKG